MLGEYDIEPPLHTNEKGTQFWVDKSMTMYAKSKELNAHVLYAKLTDGTISRLLIDSASNDVLYDTQSFEAMGTYIDMLKAVKNMVPDVSECLHMFGDKNAV